MLHKLFLALALSGIPAILPAGEIPPARPSPLAPLAPTAKRTAMQVAGGALFATAAGLAVALAGADMIACDDCCPGEPGYGSTGRGLALVFIGGPTAYLAVNSIAVHQIGQHYDQRASGRFLPTLAGSLGGAALAAALIAETRLYENTAFLTTMALLPTLGAVVGYNWSKRPPGLFSYADGQRRWGLPVPTLRLNQGPEGLTGVGIALPLIHAAL